MPGVRTLLRLLRLALLIGLSAVLLAVTVAVIAPYGYKAANATDSVDEQIDLSQLDRFAVRSYMYASDGSLLATLHGPENRSPVGIDKVPPSVHTGYRPPSRIVPPITNGPPSPRWQNPNVSNWWITWNEKLS